LMVVEEGLFDVAVEKLRVSVMYTVLMDGR
jgi:hypothetical protein